MRRTFVLIPLLMLCLVSATAAQGAVDASGKVLLKDGDKPVPQALVEFAAGAQKVRAVTLDDGSFYVPKLPAGTFTVTVSFRGRSQVFPNIAPRKGLVFRM
jgi:hypothetical protein